MSVINFYEHKALKKYLKSNKNPGFQETQMKINTRILIIGSSGSGKTNCLFNYLQNCNKTFHSVHVVYREIEPLYEMLKDKFQKNDGSPSEEVFFYNDLNQLPKLEDIQEEPQDQTLIILDDQICVPEKKLNSIVGELFIRGRKKGCTLIFISQSYFKIPKILINI